MVKDKCLFMKTAKHKFFNFKKLSAAIEAYTQICIKMKIMKIIKIMKYLYP